MVTILEEKRLYPRVKANLNLGTFKDILGNSVDFSESGLSANSTETISCPLISLELYFPDRDFKLKTDAKLIWKRDLERGGSTYGLEFINLSETQKVILRKELIKTQISGLVNHIKNREIKKRISHFFLKDVLSYISEIIRLIPHLSKDEEYSLELEKKLEHLNNLILLKGYCLEILLADKAIMQKIQDNFRQLISVWVYKSLILKRALDKPRGYAGDYRMLEFIYEKKPISKNIGLYFDNNFLRSPYATALRLRKNRLRGLLQEFINETKMAEIHILNVACGSCREIRELLSNLKTSSSITFTCLEADEEALRFSQNILSREIMKKIEFKFLKQDITDIIEGKIPVRTYSKQNLIYSVSLIDYLSDGILKKLIYALYQLLSKGGKLILTHKNREKTFPSIPPDWFCDWKFVPRNKEEVIRLFHDCGISNFSFSWESGSFGYIYYFTLTKK